MSFQKNKKRRKNYVKSLNSNNFNHNNSNNIIVKQSKPLEHKKKSNDKNKKINEIKPNNNKNNLKETKTKRESFIEKKPKKSNKNKKDDEIISIKNKPFVIKEKNELIPISNSILLQETQEIQKQNFHSIESFNTKEYKNSFFDFPLFRFTFKLVSKKISIIAVIVAYLILIMTFSFLVPFIGKTTPIKIFTNPLMSTFLVFAMAVVSCFIAIEIFRTGIDDGTELLVVSKPLSRKEIVFVKFSVFFIIILIVSIIASIFSLLSFTIKDSYYVDSLSIFGGTLVGSIVCALLFGALATIISMYQKKIISMLVTIGIAFSLMTYTLLSTIAISNPIKEMQKNNTMITPISILDISNNKFTTTDGVSYNPKNSSTDEIDTSILPSTIWNNAKNNSNYKWSSYIDIGAQLGSIFSLAIPPAGSYDAITNLAVFNAPIDLEFFKYDISTQDRNSFIEIFLPYLPNDKNLSWVDEYNKNRKLSDLFPIDLQSSSLKQVKGYSFEYQSSKNIKTYSQEDISDKLWNSIWNKKIEETEYYTYTYVGPEDGTPDTWTRSMHDQFPLEKGGKEIKISTIGEYVSYETNNYFFAWYKANWIKNIIASNNTKLSGEIDNDDLNFSNTYSSKKSINTPAQVLLRILAEGAMDDKKLSEKNALEYLDLLNRLAISGYYKLQKITKEAREGKDPNKGLSLLSFFDIRKDISPFIRLIDVFPNIADSSSKEAQLLEKLNNYLKTINANIQIKSTDTFGYLVDNVVIKYEEINNWFNEKSKYRDEYRAIIELLGISIVEVIEKELFMVENPKFISIGGSINFPYHVWTNKKLKPTTLQYTSPIRVINLDFLSNFQKIKIVTFVDRNILIPIWVLLSIIILLTTMIIYSKRDFS